MSIKIENLSYSYMLGTPLSKQALHNIELTIEENTFTAIAGQTGAGKSTLMQHIAGLLEPTEGFLTVEGVNLYPKAKKERAIARTARLKVGMVFQYPEHQLFGETVYEDIAFAPRNQGLSEAEVKQRVKDSMELVQLPQSFANRMPLALSGGERRRVAIAGVFALNPKYLILDEPTAGLDPRGREEIFRAVMKLHQGSKVAVILVSHNMDDILRLATRLIVLKQGRIIADASPSVIFRNAELIQRAELLPPRLLELERNLKAHGIIKGDTAVKTPVELAREIINVK